MKPDEILNYINILLQIIYRLLSWRILGINLVFSSIVITLFHVKLIDMKTLYDITIILWILAISIMIVKFISEAHDRLKRTRTMRAAIKSTLDMLSNLPSSEKALLKYIYAQPVDAVYIVCNNASALSLCSKGILKRITSKEYTRYYSKGARMSADCYLYGIEPEYKKLMMEHQICGEWEISSLKTELDKYQ